MRVRYERGEGYIWSVRSRVGYEGVRLRLRVSYEGVRVRLRVSFAV